MATYLLNPELNTIDPDFKGNLFDKGQFRADGMTSEASYRKVLRWQLSKNPQKLEKEKDSFRVNVVPGRSFLSGQDNMIVWLGHASFFIRVNGIQMITDPCLKDLPIVKRKVGLPCSIKEMLGLDYMLISHGHRDHFDKDSISQLMHQNPQMQLLLPLKISDLFGKRKHQVAYQEAGWWQQYKVDTLDLYFLPAKHWNRRGLTDFNQNLWGSFLIRTPQQSIYFAGDSGYAGHFKEIREKVGAPDICLMPVGAYKPSFIMQPAHMSPQEAVKAFQDLQGKVMIPMHYGTYDLSDEPLGEPVRILKQYQQENRIGGTLKMLAVGETFKI